MKSKRPLPELEAETRYKRMKQRRKLKAKVRSREVVANQNRKVQQDINKGKDGDEDHS